MIRALEEDHTVRTVMQRGIAIVGVVEAGKIFGDADRVHTGGDVFQDARIPHTLLAFAVRSIVIEVGKLPHQRALSDTRTTDDGDSHPGILAFVCVVCAFCGLIYE